MRKSLVICGVAALALASCTQSEVIDVNESRTIGFNAFVNNNTRAVTEVANGALTGYFIFGYRGADNSSLTQVVYENESNSKVAYWEKNNTYRFTAYADGNNGNIEDAKFIASTNTLKIPTYTPVDKKDLIAAVPVEVTTDGDVTNESEVQLNFVHLLSQVTFEFTTPAVNAMELKISDVKINNAIKTAGCEFNGTVTWTGTAETGIAYTYEDFDNGIDIAKQESGYKASQSKLVIPQSDTDNITVTFTATLKGDGVTPDEDSDVKTQTFTATLGYSGSTPSDNNTWVNGYHYKYTAEITPEMIDGSLTNKKIEFKTDIIGWEDATSTPVTPTKP